MKANERLICALDVSNVEQAANLVVDLAPYVGTFKVGHEFIYGNYAALMEGESDERAFQYLLELRQFHRYTKIGAFFDVKLNDIPNTMGKAAKAIASMTPAMFNVHASAGMEGIKRAVAMKGSAKVFGVTVLTSLQEQECREIFGNEPQIKVLEFAHMLKDAGADGIICAPREGLYLRDFSKFNKLLIACPNVRPDWMPGGDDQNKERQMTPHQAMKAGIDMLVIGRPITNPPPEIGGPVKAAMRIVEEIAAAL